MADQLDALEAAIRAGIASALRSRASVHRERAAEGMATLSEFPGVIVRSPEASIAGKLAAAFETIAAELAPPPTPPNPPPN